MEIDCFLLKDFIFPIIIAYVTVKYNRGGGGGINIRMGEFNANAVLPKIKYDATTTEYPLNTDLTYGSALVSMDNGVLVFYAKTLDATLSSKTCTLVAVGYDTTGKAVSVGKIAGIEGLYA